ncbi:NAD-dependent epimerase/dehydratase family protein [Klebsiella michiganensis]|uniref:NAD(P)H-binding protein n=1 Tax=Klebsiella michiganensis TaxID=1134687 RepID=A0A6P1V8F3_9ENTR|nr:NAD-dependent epimerase/dehydratase family protein [Klebsiella michiganensis]QHS49979.1 NAD(P)H-binding protein [Klebsiella michiganensis]HDX8940891.1 NAD(P)H-binding protein [Klebsiella michiganensis]
MKVGVIGASGVIGRSLLPQLRAQGMTVRGIVRPGSKRTLPDGIQEVVMADVLDESALVLALQGLDAVINLATRIPASGGDWQQNDQIRTKGMRCLLDALAWQARPCRLVQQSIAMLHQSTEVTDESGELCGKGILASALWMEGAVQGAPVDWVLIRGAAVYGPGTARDDAYFARIRDGEVALPNEPDRYLSLIHVEDLARAYVTALHAPSRHVYIASDDAPLTYRALFSGLRPRGSVNANASPLTALPSFRVSNRRLKNLGWQPCYPGVFFHRHLSAGRA